MQKPLVVIGLLGTQLDQASRGNRWDRWRPSVAICQQPDLIIHRFELLCDDRSQTLARTVTQDISSVSPETEVKATEIRLDDPWDFEEVYSVLHDFARSQRFDTERFDYLVHITTGTHVAQICLFLLTESRHFPARLLQSSPHPKIKKDAAGGLPHHRSRSIQIRSTSRPFPQRAARSNVVSKVWHRNAGRKL